MNSVAIGKKNVDSITLSKSYVSCPSANSYIHLNLPNLLIPDILYKLQCQNANLASSDYIIRLLINSVSQSFSTTSISAQYSSNKITENVIFDNICDFTNNTNVWSYYVQQGNMAQIELSIKSNITSSIVLSNINSAQISGIHFFAQLFLPKNYFY